jgi:hypothetical protein
MVPHPQEQFAIAALKRHFNATSTQLQLFRIALARTSLTATPGDGPAHALVGTTTSVAISHSLIRTLAHAMKLTLHANAV